MKLEEYAKKRNFRKTPEPGRRGNLSRQKGKDLIFVVQEHHASHLHYDFRLEWNCVLRSWSVPKGPSLDPGTKRLAVEVEDHPVAYASFEGTIPAGEYGGGDVKIWDQGTWVPKGDAGEGLEGGKLEFELKGKKLKGSWLLLRTKREARKPQWLLIKRRDAAAAPAPRKSAASANRSRKPRAEALAAGFLPLQMAFLVQDPPRGENWLHERKFDGYRIEASIRQKKARLRTRTGLDWTKRYPPIARALAKLAVKNAVLDGEVVWADEKGAGDFQKLQNAMNAGDLSHLHYYVFDLLELDGEDLRPLPLLERKERLRRILPEEGEPIHFSEHVVGNASELLRESCREEGEGIMSKRADARYHSGRHESWVKSKCQKRQEFVIGGFTEGKRAGFGALLLGVFEKGELKYVGRVGTGFTAESIAELRERLDPLRRKDSPFTNAPYGKGLRWVEPKLLAEISFANWTSDRKLRVPVFHGLREDKPAGQVGKEEPIPPPSGSEELPLTHPDKIYFVKEKLSKLDVAKYYAAVAPLLLPQVADRPLSLKRCPEGTSGECFFQKHISAGSPAALESVEIKETKGVRQHMKVRTAEGLMALVQMGALELHAWNSRAENLAHPDQIVMDFDPGPGVKWADLVKAARALKEILSELGLESFVKLSGGKGLHVQVPIAPIYEWDEIKEFSRTLARELESRDPGHFTVGMNKAARHGKIFLDYLRNAEMATTVVPYSLRARETSSVALPVEWEELGRIKSSDQFTLPKALEKIRRRKRDPWEGYSSPQRISILEGGRRRAA